MSGMLGWPDWLMMLVVVLILLGAKKPPELGKGIGAGATEVFESRGCFKQAVRDLLEERYRDPKNRDFPSYSAEPRHLMTDSDKKQSTTDRLVLFVAQGFGTGRVPKAPGTWGSVLGLGWFAFLLWIAGWQPVLAGFILFASIIAAVWNCDAGEKILGAKDPGSIVIDEIVAVPVCFLGWVFHLTLQLGDIPSLDFFFGPTTWYIALGVFLAFRFFDISKPWPVKQSQDIPNGWGVVLDDILAAVYVNLVILLVHVALQLL